MRPAGRPSILVAPMGRRSADPTEVFVSDEDILTYLWTWDGGLMLGFMYVVGVTVFRST